MYFKNIMIVEDEQLNILFLKEILKNYSYDNIWCYTSSEEAIEAVKYGEVPDLILMDINLGQGKDGIYTASKIKNMYKSMPIIFMSAYDDEEILEEVFNVSLYGFVSKPFSERTMQIAIALAQRNFIKNDTNIDIQKQIILSEDVYYDLESTNIIEDNKIISIPVKQKKLLDILIKNINCTMEKTQLSFEIWSDSEVGASSLRTLIYLLKKRFKDIPIYTHSKEGYIFRDML